jgi:hypothetical protein
MGRKSKIYNFILRDFSELLKERENAELTLEPQLPLLIANRNNDFE